MRIYQYLNIRIPHFELDRESEIVGVCLFNIGRGQDTATNTVTPTLYVCMDIYRYKYVSPFFSLCLNDCLPMSNQTIEFSIFYRLIFSCLSSFLS